MVGKQPVVAKFPSEEITDEENGDRRGRAGHVGLIGGCREWYGAAIGLAVPFESGRAALGYRHCEHFKVDDANVNYLAGE